MEFQWYCCYRIHNTNEWFNQPTSDKIPKGHIFDKLQLNLRSWVFETISSIEDHKYYFILTKLEVQI